MLVPKVDKLIGIELFATKSSGISGVIRQSVEDFIVEEVLVDGSKAEINKSNTHQVLGSSPIRNRYLMCVLFKRNWDSFQAIKMIARQLGVSTGQIQIAGIKDAKAITAQHITIENITIEDIQKVNVKDIEIHPIGYVRNKLSSYYLLGNTFHITIRDVNHSSSVIKKRVAKILEELQETGGVPNFFGHQRFGTVRPITHLVGKALAKGNFRKAAMLFLAKPSHYEHPESRQTRKQLQITHNFEQALKDFPKQLHYERSMLKHLVKEPDDFIGAFRRLPIKLRELFPQAYQAYLFNKFLSKRIENGFPLNRAEVGDYTVSVERSGLPTPMVHKLVNSGIIKEVNYAIKTGKMRLAIPLVGFKQHPSRGVQGEIEKQILEEEGVSMESFKIRDMPEISARGELRTAITSLNDFSLNQIS
ncbi:MAG TPA: tRNA pseudouridine(13) synthase TruD, partial [Acidobacteriota bacterium]|nr:tRNA pseudouridine(13) synthase TruD [Acidobacteriota bacterium]